jgi:hypothetical protein
MDEGGREQMTFVLKEGLVHIVDNHGFANNTIEGVVETPELSQDFNLEVSVNNGPYRAVSKTLKLSEDELKRTEVSIVFRATHKKKTVYYKSDTIPLTHAFILGKNLEDRYPEVLKFLLKEQENLGEEMKALRYAILKDVSNTSNYLKGTMVELVDTFEEINKKGSLF